MYVVATCSIPTEVILKTTINYFQWHRQLDWFLLQHLISFKIGCQNIRWKGKLGGEILFEAEEKLHDKFSMWQSNSKNEKCLPKNPIDC